MTYKLFKDIYVRTGKHERSDRRIAGECARNYVDIKTKADDVIVDLGANIGGFYRMIRNQEFLDYIAVEPDRENIKVIKENSEGDRRLIVAPFAVSMSNQKMVTFYQTDSKNSACSGTVTPVSNRSMSMRKVRQQVPNINIVTFLTEFQPTILKVDIEGAENNWLAESKGIPENMGCLPRIMFLELHGGDMVQEHIKNGVIDNLREYYDISGDVNCGFVDINKPKLTIDGLPEVGEYGNGALFGIDLRLELKK